jgi:hypothetical protein
VTFLALRDGTVRLKLSMKERQNFDPTKARMEKIASR